MNVAYTLADHLRRHTGSEGNRCVGVVVQPDSWETVASNAPLEGRLCQATLGGLSASHRAVEVNHPAGYQIHRGEPKTGDEWHHSK